MSHTEDRNEGFLSRWSRRKLTDETVTDDVIDVDAVHAPAINDEAALEAEEPLLTDADMPALETLTEDSDYSGFMSSGVSEELRQLALRQLFRSAVFNERDGLDDYDEDFTSFEKLGDIVTSDMRFQIEREEQKRRQQALQDEEPVEAVSEENDQHEQQANERPVDEIDDLDATSEKPDNDKNIRGED